MGTWLCNGHAHVVCVVCGEQSATCAQEEERRNINLLGIHDGLVSLSSPSPLHILSSYWLFIHRKYESKIRDGSWGTYHQLIRQWQQLWVLLWVLFPTRRWEFEWYLTINHSQWHPNKYQYFRFISNIYFRPQFWILLRVLFARRRERRRGFA